MVAAGFGLTLFVGCADAALPNEAERATIADDLSLQEPPPPPNFGKPELEGKGCPDKSWKVVFEGDDPERGGSFTIFFEQFDARLGPDHSLSAASTFCNIAVPIHVPQGLQYAVSSFRYEGFADLREGVLLSHFADYWFIGDSEVAVVENASETRKGPATEFFRFEDDVSARDPKLLNWSACASEAVVMVNLREVLSASTVQTGTSLIEVHKANGAAKLELEFVGRKCEP